MALWKTQELLKCWLYLSVHNNKENLTFQLALRKFRVVQFIRQKSAKKEEQLEIYEIKSTESEVNLIAFVFND